MISFTISEQWRLLNWLIELPLASSLKPMKSEGMKDWMKQCTWRDSSNWNNSKRNSRRDVRSAQVQLLFARLHSLRFISCFFSFVLLTFLSLSFSLFLSFFLLHSLSLWLFSLFSLFGSFSLSLSLSSLSLQLYSCPDNIWIREIRARDQWLTWLVIDRFII